MKWNPNLSAVLRTKWRFRHDGWAALSRRGACLKRGLSHASLQAPTRRAASPRFA